ncbi:hypothetical protein ABPG75_004432 [Micractinium tetrahymenae]
MALCKAWLPTLLESAWKGMRGQVDTKLAAIVTASPGAGDCLPASATVPFDGSAYRQLPVCAACGKQAVELQRCGPQPAAQMQHTAARSARGEHGAPTRRSARGGSRVWRELDWRLVGFPIPLRHPCQAAPHCLARGQH